ncbi:MAG: hypothetical protein ABSG27_09765 [Candidatus Acidiferrales bacterium]|jgi:hypothetical protein
MGCDGQCFVVTGGFDGVFRVVERRGKVAELAIDIEHAEIAGGAGVLRELVRFPVSVECFVEMLFRRQGVALSDHLGDFGRVRGFRCCPRGSSDREDEENEKR